jgi:hypothetical protein
VVLWVHHRANLLSPALDADLPTTSARIQIPDLAAGTWQVTWWDIAQGRPLKPTTLSHGGGALSLPTPDIRRHAAAWLERQN